MVLAGRLVLSLPSIIGRFRFNSSFRSYPHQDDHTIRTTDTTYYGKKNVHFVKHDGKKTIFTNTSKFMNTSLLVD